MLSGKETPSSEPRYSPSSDRVDTLIFPPVSERTDTLPLPPLSEQTTEARSNGTSEEVRSGVLPWKERGISSNATDRDACVGDVIAERYLLQAHLAQGSMGIVWRAYDRRLEVPVAIKLISSQLALATEAARRLREEATLLARVDSLHVARIIDAGDTENGAPYLVTELLEGITLQQLLELGIDLPIHQALGWISQAAQGLADIHDVGLVHNDLKPSNVFLTRDGTVETTVKLLDLGVARAGSASTPLSMGDELLGNPWYMAPERIAAAADADHRGDIWSLGVILYELVTGRRPFEGHTVQQVCAAVMAATPPPVLSLRPNATVALERVVSRCLQPRPENRYFSARSLSEELRRLHSARASHDMVPVKSLPVLGSSPIERKPGDLRRSKVAVVHRWRWTAAFALLWAPLLVAVALGIVAMKRYHPAQAQLPAGPSPTEKSIETSQDEPTSTMVTQQGAMSAREMDNTTTPAPVLAATPSTLRQSISNERLTGRTYRSARAKTTAPNAIGSGIPVDDIYVDRRGRLVDALGNPIDTPPPLPSSATVPQNRTEVKGPGSWH